MSKRQRRDNKEILKKPAATPVDIVRGFEDAQLFTSGTGESNAAEFAWDDAVRAALELLNPSKSDNRKDNSRAQLNDTQSVTTR